MTAVAAAGVLLLAVAGCGGSDSGGDGPVELRFGWWGNAEREKITQRVIDAFQAEHPDIKVKGETSDFTAYFDKLATEVAAGSAPDVITLGGAYPREYGDRGALADISGLSGQLKTDKIDAAALENGKFGGVQYGVPTGVNAVALVVNPELITQTGLPMPDTSTWTWEQFVAFARQLAPKMPAGTFALADPTRTDMVDVFSRQRDGVSTYDADGKVVLNPATVTAWLTMTKDLMASGVTPPAATTGELQSQPNPEQRLIGRGLAAMEFEWSNQLTNLRKASGKPLELHPLPGESSAAQRGVWLQASQVFTINNRSEHQEEAATFINFMINEAGAGRIVLCERGVPSNSEVREAILPELPDDQAAQAEYIAAVGANAGSPLVIGPTGSADVWRTLDRINVEVLFDRMTPQAGAQDFIKQVKQAVEE